MPREVIKIMVSSTVYGFEKDLRVLCATIESYKIPLPPIKLQQKIVQQLDTLSFQTKQLEAVYKKKLNSLEELKKAVLQKAFSGELTKEEVQPLQVAFKNIEGISTTDLHAGIIAIAFDRHEKANAINTFHHVKSEKIVHLIENHLLINLERNPVKDAAGPNDYPLTKKIESRAGKAGFFYVQQHGKMHNYKKGSKFDDLIKKVNDKLGNQLQSLHALIDLLIPMDTERAEVVATVYAAWNNLLLQQKEITEEAIVTEARENWHESKLKIERSKFFKTIEWMRSKQLVPIGIGKLVLPK